MKLPNERGPLSRLVRTELASPGAFDVNTALTALATITTDDVVRDDDLQITLWILYELHYAGFEDLPVEREWDPDVLRLRRELERLFLQNLQGIVKDNCATERDTKGPLTARYGAAHGGARSDFGEELRALIESSVESPPLTTYLHRVATGAQMQEFLRQRSLYHRKEADPHAFVVPRVDGPTKVALVELLYDEYGCGRAASLHSKLFADALVGAGLNPSYGAYVNETRASTLAVNNLMSLFGLHRRWRGAALGHLAAFEATSSVPARKISAGIERVGLPAVVSAYFDEHVEADAVHEEVALRDICGRFVGEQPLLADDVRFGALACLALDAIAAADQLASWSWEDAS